MRYTDQADNDFSFGYRHGVDRVMVYIESINAYPKLIAELRWAIEEGII